MTGEKPDRKQKRRKKHPPVKPPTGKKNVDLWCAREPKYEAHVNLSMWQPESLVLISLCIYSQGADRRGAGNLDGNSCPPGPNFHPNFPRVFSGEGFSRCRVFPGGGFFLVGFFSGRFFSGWHFVRWLFFPVVFFSGGFFFIWVFFWVCHLSMWRLST